MTVHQSPKSLDTDAFPVWEARAEEVARELRRSVAQRDIEGGQPRAEIDLLRQAGLLTILIPKELGGGGATVSQALRIARILAKGDTSIAQLAVHHLFGTLIGLKDGKQALVEKRLNGFLRQGWFHAGIAQAAYEPLIVASRDGDGFLLNGAKPFTSGAAVADTLQVWVRFAPGVEIDGVDASGHVGQFIVANPTPGLSFGDDWDNIGQRLTVSGSTRLNDVRVEAADLVSHRDEGAPQTAAETLPVVIGQLGFTELYVGTALGAFEEAVAYTREKARPWLTSPAEKASEDILVIERYGRLSVAIASMVALADEAGRVLDRAIARGAELTDEERGAAAVIAYQTKVHATEVALEVTSRIFELTGARSTTRALGLDRYWRNVRTHTLHDPVHYKVLEVGDFALNGRAPTPTYYS